MFSEKTINLAKQLMEVYSELDKSIREDTRGIAHATFIGPLQVFFTKPHDADEQLMRRYLPKVTWVTETKEFKHLHYTIGGIDCVSLVKKFKED